MQTCKRCGKMTFEENNKEDLEYIKQNYEKIKNKLCKCGRITIRI